MLSKDLTAYIEAQKRGDQQRVEQIKVRAVRRGKKGWHVGQNERFRPLGSPGSRQETGEHESHGPLSYQHQRRAHFRLLPNQKVTFVRQATVRPDLPPPPQGAGYRLE